MNNCIINKEYNNSSKRSRESKGSKGSKGKKKEIIIETEEMSQECIEDIYKNKEKKIKNNSKNNSKNNLTNKNNENNENDKIKTNKIKKEKKLKKNENENKNENKKIINNLMDYNFEEDVNKNESFKQDNTRNNIMNNTVNDVVNNMIDNENYDLKVEKYLMYMDNYKDALCNLIDYVKSLNIIPVKAKIKLPFIKNYINNEDNDDELLTNGIEYLLNNRELIINFNIDNIYDFNEFYSKVNKKNEFLDLIDEFVSSIKKKRNQIEKENIDVIKGLFEYIFKLLEDINSLF